MKRLAGLTAILIVAAGCASTESGGSTLAAGASSAAITSSMDSASVESTAPKVMTARGSNDDAPNGDYLVGTDIASGVWQCRDAGESVYWKTTDKAGGIINNDLGSIARVDASAFAVKLKGCETDWIAVKDLPETAAASVKTSDSTSGSGSASRDADVALCHHAYGRFSGELRADLDAAVLAGHLSPLNMWFAASTFGSVHVGDASGTIARSIGDFNAAALLLTQGGIVDMIDEDAQNFMQSYYDKRTACEDINAWQ
jgi:hypothetical protein